MYAQNRDYPSYTQLTKRLQQISAQNSKLVSLTTIGKTATGKEIWLLTLGRENAANKPAIVIAAGVDPRNLAAIELSLQMAEQLLQAAVLQDSVLKLLQTKTIYILPNLNPDATEQYHEKLRWERIGNAQPSDEDRDGHIFEDPFEDLNKDDMITQMRIKDSTGLYIPSKKDPRVMILADPAKGEKGQYKVYSEGIDNDKDGRWNEDPEGGTHFNRNFSFDYPYFKEGAGEHPMSERETKAFADFLFDAPNVYALFLLGPANTLTHPLKFDKSKIQGPLITGLLEKDALVGEHIAALYKSKIKTENAPSTPPVSGDVLQWAYFHFGHYSYSTPAWWTPIATSVTDSITSDQLQSLHEDVNYLLWAKENDIAGVFVKWEKVDHPDFPGQLVEVGGLAPYVKFTPPMYLLAPVVLHHLNFFTAYLSIMPSLKITGLTTQDAGKGLVKVTADIENTGILPSHAEIGDQMNWVQKVRISLKLEEDQKLVTGNRIQLFEAIPGKGKVQVNWVVSGKGFVSVEVDSPTAGKQVKEILLKR